MDLYQRLGIKRGASEAEVKKAYRSLAKQLHPDRNKDNPQAAKRFGEVTNAYDILSDKDKRARYDRGEIDEDGNPKSPFGSGGFGGGFGGSGAGPRPGAGGGFEGFPGGFDAAGAADLSDLFEGLFGAAGARRGGGGFGGRTRAPRKGDDVAYRLKVPFIDAATLKPQRVTLGERADDRRQAAQGGRKWNAHPPCRAGRVRAGRAGRRHRHHRDRAGIRSIVREGQDIRLSLPVTLKEAVLGAKVRVPTPEGAVMLTVPKGSSSGKVLRLKDRGFTDKSGKRGDQLVVLSVDLPRNDAALEQFAEQWDGGGNPRAALGV